MIDRREFLKVSGMALAAGLGQNAGERSVQTPTLDIGYVESGNPSGFPIVLLHGFPDDVHAYEEVAPPLAQAGHRVLVPYLRGYGSTRFRDANAPRMAEQAAIGQDVIDFADALKLPRFAVAGYDWGGRAAQVASALHPDRIRAGVFVAGYSIQDVFAAPRPAAPQVEAAFWYQWYFNTERGRAGLAQNRRALCKLLWQQWSPTWKFSDATYDRTAPSFDNPDFVDCVIHSYRHRNLNAKGDPRFDAVEHQLAMRPTIDVPVILIYGADDGLARPSQDGAADRALFPKLIDRRIVAGAGHFLPREKPEAISSALLQLLHA
ncbi:MAG TPA: alpha/beta hydrolase [Vicinamibacterales bacterium]|nr:alpha/beta hydrolase [Vicinamibacterales bacterium]